MATLASQSRARRHALVFLSAVAVTLGVFTVSAAPSSATAAPPAYYPSGPQTGVPVSTVEAGGWTQCFLDEYANDMEAELPGLLSACSGDYLMLAGRPTGSNVLTLLAAAPRDDVLFDTGATFGDGTHQANGTGWYFNAHFSWGFAPAGDAVSKGECDILRNPDDGLRLCWHTVNASGGYRLGSLQGLNNSTAYERLVFEPGAALAAQTITFPPLPDVTYGAPDITPGATADSGLPVSYSTIGTSSPCTIVAGKIHIVGTGTCTVYADQAGDATHAPAPQVSRSFTIHKANINVTPAPATGPYGTVPSVSPTYSGFQYGETPAVLTSPATCQANTTTTTPPGTYQNKSSCSGAAAANYTFTYHLGTVTIVKAAVTLASTATSATASRTAGRMTFTSTATNTASGAPIAGLSVTVHVKINNFYTVTCTATTNASGVATCSSGNGNLLLINYPHPYTVTSPATALYLAGSGSGTIPK
jgi:MBG domain (YGX type)